MSRLLSVAYFSGHRLHLGKHIVWLCLCGYAKAKSANAARLAFFLYLPTSIFPHMPYIIAKKSMDFGSGLLSGYFTQRSAESRLQPDRETRECSLLFQMLKTPFFPQISNGSCLTFLLSLPDWHMRTGERKGTCANNGKESDMVCCRRKSTGSIKFNG